MKVKLLSHVRLFATHGLQPITFLWPWDFPGKNTGMGCHFLLQGIFPIQGLNLRLLHCSETLYCQTTREALGRKNHGKSVLCLVTQSSLAFCDLVDCNPPGSPVHGNSPVRNTRVGCHTLLQGGLSSTGIKLRSPTLQVDSLLSEPPGKRRHHLANRGPCNQSFEFSSMDVRFGP